jgi:spoIIIJ-associated protein
VDERKDQPREGALLVDDDARHDDLDAANEPEGRAGDGKAEEAADSLEDLLDHMDLDADVNIREDGENIVLDIEGPDAGRAIGKKGQTLDALQFLVNKMVNRFPGGRRHVVVDSGDYRERHDMNLEALARREAKRAVTEGKVVTLEPMSARDRRVIHLSLAKIDDVSTESQGQGMQRRIQIIPAKLAERGGGGGKRRRG